MHSLTFHEPKQHGTLEFPAEYHYLDKGHSRYHMPFHWHKEWEIVYVIKGTFVAYADNEQYTAQSGDVILFRDGMLHGGIPSDCIYECIVFDLHGLYRNLDIVKKYLRPIYSQQILPYIFYSCKQNPDICATVSEMTRAFRQHTGDPACESCGETFHESPLELTTIGCLSRLFSLILCRNAYTQAREGTSEGTRRIDLIKSVLEYIEAHYASPITLQDLAHEAGMNPKYFCRFFRSITHQTPMGYVNRYRIDRASQLLSQTTLPIISVAMECGFNDTSNFIKVFRKFKGMTPGQYRKQ